METARVKAQTFFKTIDIRKSKFCTEWMGMSSNFNWEKYGALAQKLYKHHSDGKQLHRFENNLTHIVHFWFI